MVSPSEWDIFYRWEPHTGHRLITSVHCKSVRIRPHVLKVQALTRGHNVHVRIYTFFDILLPLSIRDVLPTALIIRIWKDRGLLKFGSIIEHSEGNDRKVCLIGMGTGSDPHCLQLFNSTVPNLSHISSQTRRVCGLICLQAVRTSGATYTNWVDSINHNIHLNWSVTFERVKTIKKKLIYCSAEFWNEVGFEPYLLNFFDFWLT